MNTATILRGDAVTMLRTLPAKSVHCCVTSPPYFGLRSYLPDGHADKVMELGAEPTPAEYVSNMVAVFAEVWRVLRDDGTLWLNLGDSYNGSGGTGGATPKHLSNVGSFHNGKTKAVSGLKPKDLVGIPWRLAFALQDAGWYLRSDVIWHKPNPMPESVTDRPTKAHEYVFLLTKRARYFYDAVAVAEAATEYAAFKKSGTKILTDNYHGDSRENGIHPTANSNGTRNRRSVWTINPEPTPYAHFATMPTALVEPCILAGTSARGVCSECGAPWVRVVEKTPYTPPSAGQGERNVDASRGDKNRKLNGKSAEFRESQASTTTIGWVPSCTCTNPHAPESVQPIAPDPIPATVLDPFAGSGTTLRVAVSLGRDAIGVELNSEYADLAERLLAQTQPALIAV